MTITKHFSEAMEAFAKMFGNRDVCTRETVQVPALVELNVKLKVLKC